MLHAKNLSNETTLTLQLLLIVISLYISILINVG